MANGAAAVDILYAVRRFSALDSVCVDGWLFRLHYWATSTALLAASLVSFAKQYFGDPIECIFDAKHGAEIKAVDAYCWLHSTVHLDTSLIRKLNTMSKIRSPCPGYHAGPDRDLDTMYYQWVPFFLLLQALVFRLPWCLWRHLEGGRMAEFGTEAKRHLMQEENSETLALHYAAIFRSILHHNNPYFWQFYLCETLNLVLVVGMIYLTDAFLDGRFIHYGHRVWDFYNTPLSYRGLKANPMCSLFPTVTSCQFPSGAVTGNLNVDHAMCVLSLNIINDKIFLIEWFWFYLLAALAASATFFTTVAVICPKIRRVLIRWRFRTPSTADRALINDLLKRCHVGDWFVLSLLAKNTNPYLYRRIVKAIAENIREQQHR